MHKVMFPIAVLALVAGVLAPTAAQARTVNATASSGRDVERAAYRVMAGGGLQYLAPLKLIGGQAAVTCDPYSMRLPLSTTCMMRIRYPKAACLVTIDVRADGHASGQLACGRWLKPVSAQWTWAAKFTAYRQRVEWADAPSRAGAVPWPA